MLSMWLFCLHKHGHASKTWMDRMQHEWHVNTESWTEQRSCTHPNLMHPSLVWGHKSQAEELRVMPFGRRSCGGPFVIFQDVVQWLQHDSARNFPRHLLIHTDPIGPTIVLWPLWCIKSACLILHDHNTVGVFTKEGCSPQFLDVSSSDAWWRVFYSSYQMLVHYLITCVCGCVSCVFVYSRQMFIGI